MTETKEVKKCSEYQEFTKDNQYNKEKEIIVNQLLQGVLTTRETLRALDKIVGRTLVRIYDNKNHAAVICGVRV